MHWVIRGLIGLWGAGFGWTGLQGLFNPQSYHATIGLTGDATAMNTIRADISAFFLVSAACALIVAVQPRRHHLLAVPIALFAIALFGRLLGVLTGDAVSPIIQTSMIAEALSVALLGFAAYRLRRTASHHI